MKLKLLLLAICIAIGFGANAQDAASSADKPKTETNSKAESPSAANSSTTDAPAKKGGKVVNADRLDLETTVVTGNRELPRVLYIVPWKRADIGELPAQPFNTLLDEMLQPVDRDVFKREVKYYQTVSSGVGKNSAAPSAASTAPSTSSDDK